MDIHYEKMPNIENSSSSGVYLDEPIRVQETPARIRHYFVFSLFSAICLCPATGLVALAYSLKSSAKADVKFHDKARLYSRRALLWNLISIIVATASIFLVLAFFYYVNAIVQMGSVTDFDVYQKQRAQEINNEINRMVQSFSNEK
ncbi:unnamed protein product [Rotaria socialis]|uniref:Interferon-induced transmembrane protein n=1 Tax=Rotaria socialis TaxID=392032 RepID=A0A817XD76_9BILA|nr:unnamed protein product [Rotaria socialis]CAF3371044.1 unnamed protein product [Rotaria socialis]CAF3395131.1 unnamed protein product [Rotaria socialis]CAF3447310.1 unnamed protein product [Rotaria socialis]CAF3784351.1 unnamed protein product [Rotaria socialis]